MNPILIVALVVAGLAITTVLTCYFTARYFFRFTILRKPTATLDNNINANTDWSKHLDFIKERKAWLYEQKLENVFIKSDDGLKLHGTVVRSKTAKNCVICFHGYTSNGINNFGSMTKFYIENDFNVIMVDERAHGESEGKYIGFGVLDRHDALNWIEFAKKTFGENVNIFLHGVSMGGSTVLMTSGLELPKNVKAIVADCAFTSAYDVFSHILKRDYHIPKFPIMNMTEMLTKKHAGYGYNDVCTLRETAKTNVPILFIHGDKDDFVPTWMSEKNFEACGSEKELLIVKGADHAEAYYVGREDYEKSIKKYMKKYAV